jgi:hypothetical protein
MRQLEVKVQASVCRRGSPIGTVTATTETLTDIVLLDGLAIREMLPAWQHRPDAPPCMSGVSTNDRGQSVENQLAPLQEAAGRLGWTVVATKVSAAPGGAPTGLDWMLC